MLTLLAQLRNATGTLLAVAAYCLLQCQSCSEAQAPHDIDSARDLAGRWKVMRVEDFLSTETPTDTQMLISANTITFNEGNDTGAMSIVIDATKQPQAIDLSWDDPKDHRRHFTIKGIFQVEGDDLLLCLADASDGSIVCGPIEPKTARPKTFTKHDGELISARRITTK